MGKISVIGIGPGSREYLTPAAKEAIEKADVIVGGRNALSLVAGKKGEKIIINKDLNRVLNAMKGHKKENVAVLVSGDPGFYSILGLILKNFKRGDIEIIPGVSSVQLCFAKLYDTWHNSQFVSLHGRDMSEVMEAVGSKKVVILTDGDSTPDRVARYLLDRGVVANRKTAVCDSLSLPEERVVVADLEGISQMSFSSNCVMVIYGPQLEDKGQKKRWEFATPGIPDSHFIRDKAPMTKEEVRAVTLSKARIMEDSIIYDIGAGSGSISIEAAIIAKNGRVYSIEKQAKRLSVIRANIKNFGILNINPILGEAPDALEDLPEANRIIIGGSGGRLEEILLKCSEKLIKDGVVVINAITLDTLNEACRVLDEMGFEFKITQVSISRARTAGKQRLMTAMNPVFIIDARKK